MTNGKRASGDGTAAGAATIEGNTTIVIADDHAVVRSALRVLLDSEPDLDVVAEAEDVESAAARLREHHPRVLLLDLSMPGVPSLKAMPALREEFPDTAIVILTMQNDPSFAREALRVGATGYVLKEAADAELVDAIHAAAEGDRYLNAQLEARLASDSRGPRGELSEREVEVLRLIALGHTNSEIAAQLGLSVRTVESHRAHIQNKLGLTTRAQLVRHALDHHLIET
jgi:two-component system response regulator NreC